VSDETPGVLSLSNYCRDQGIGTALVTAAAGRRDELFAEFDPGVAPFWEAVGFETEPAGESGRRRGHRR